MLAVCGASLLRRGGGYLRTFQAAFERTGALTIFHAYVVRMVVLRSLLRDYE